MPKGIPKKPGEEQQLEGGGAGAGAGTNARSRLQSNIGADAVLKNLREKFNVSKESLNAKRDIRDPSTVSEKERAQALNQYRRNKAAEEATTDEGVTKYPYVEPTEKKKGGLTASRRADGIASRGKTRGRIV